MRHLLWVLLAGLLATAVAQVQAQTVIERLATDSVERQVATHKAAQGILQDVGDIVASLIPERPVPEATSDSGQTNGTVTEASESVPSETEETPTDTNETVLIEDNEAPVEEVEEATPTEPTPEEEQPEVVKVKLTKKERKAVRKYNTAVDQVLVILSKQLNEVGPIPIALDEQALLALDADDVPVPEPDQTTPESTRKRKKNKDRKKKNKNRKNNRRRNQASRNEEVGKSNGQKRNKNNSAERNNNSAEKGNKKNKNKNNNDNNSGEKNNNARRRKNKNQRNNNKRKNQNKNDASNLKREPKALHYNVEMSGVEQGRRKDTQAQPANNQQGNKRKANKRKTQKNKNKQMKNKNKQMKNKGRMDLESRADTGPSLPTDEELSQSNARLTGLAKLTRNGHVTVDLSGKKQRIDADITIGPLEVNLKDKSKALTKAQVTTSLTAVASFKVRTVRRRNKINVEGIEVTELLPEEVVVTRSDLDLEDEVVTLAQQQVVGAVDTARLGRILSKVLTNIFNEDNIVENLDSHPLL